MFHLNEGTLERHALNTELSDQSVYIVEPLDDRTVVLGAERGLYQLNPITGRLFRYGPLEGFIGQETNARAIFRGLDEKLWIGTVQGATRMDTLFPMPSIPPLTPQISRLATDLKQASLDGDNGVIPPDDRGLQVDYIAVSPKNPEGIEYSYRLRGVDEAWSPPTQLTNVRFASLGHGSYTFEVRARHSGDGWSKPVARSIVVEPPVWQTAWFRALALASLMFAVILIIQLRIRQEKAVSTTLRSLVAERTQHLEAEIAERRRSEAALVKAQAKSREAQRELEALNVRLRDLALTDPLTDLPNRRAFEQSLAMSVAEASEAVSVLFLDLNGFKSVNDTYGHEAGDELIRIIGKRLASWARTSDFVARLGGDEFVIIATACPPAAAREVAERVGVVIAEPVALAHVTVQVGASIGIACSPTHANTANELIRKADLAMYHAKRVIKAPLAFFDELPSEGSTVRVV
ncbi:MAG: GGDEF domain-containing protein [Pseudomonadota bacterium]